MILNLIYRSLRQHALATVVTAAGIALAAGLLLTVWVVKTQSQACSRRPTPGSMPCSARAVPSCSWCSMPSSTSRPRRANIAWNDYEMIRRHPAVKARHADRARRQLPQLPHRRHDGGALRPRSNTCPGSTISPSNRPEFRAGLHEAVAGSFVGAASWASLTDPSFASVSRPELQRGRPQHDGRIRRRRHACEPTNTPVDRVMWIPLAGRAER
jgi:putative ABC transport system permease protein